MAAETAAERGIEDVSAELLDNVTCNAILKLVADDSAEVAADLAAVEFIGEAVSEVAEILMIIQLLGMVLDSWDPNGFNQMLTGSMVKTISDVFNAQFETIVLQSMTKTHGAFGKPVVLATWPIEYYADSLIAKETGAYDDKYWLNRTVGLTFDYIGSLKANSDGVPIYWPPGGDQATKNQDTWDQFKDSVALVAADGNAVVGQWISRWWIVLLLLAIVFVIFILLLK
jgi:hypothetical protein